MYDGTYIVSNPIIAYRSTLDQSRETWSSKINASCDSLVPYYIYYYYRIKNIVINIVITINTYYLSSIKLKQDIALAMKIIGAYSRYSKSYVYKYHRIC